jgi:hypothetical protein
MTPAPLRLCALCPTKFAPKRPDQIYCGNRCRLKAAGARFYQASKLEKERRGKK